MIKAKNIVSLSLFFPTAMWLYSRILICIAMLFIAPLLPAPPNGVIATFSWDVFSAWDSGWYQHIATSGYEYLNDTNQHSVAFYPLFPLFSRVVMSFGLPFEVAGTIVNNLAFLGALIVLYAWISEHHGTNTARWTTAVLAWCPLSIFGTVTYSEGLYLLFSTAALRAFDKKEYGWMAVWGAIASAGRPTGIALITAFFVVTWLERRGVISYLASLASGSGLFLYSLYCQIKFGDALAFFHAQKAWRPTLGFDWLRWWKMLVQITIGTGNWKAGYIKDPWHPLLFALIMCSFYLVWRFRKKLGSVKVDYGNTALGFLLWLLAGDPLTNVVMIFGSIYLLWYLRHQLSLITVFYGLCGIGMLLASGGTISLNRLTYGIVSVSVALGVILASHPRWGRAVMGFFALLLASFAVRFSQNLWVA